ncbi:MAG: hypothetical protein JJ866_24815 [Roseibium sp.]|uniref:hypothetical protein n=1 Tax=Roseibium sp. TaxID=1936156 RepID=UPI001B2C73F8|nr:hypothetical protein [Roseibium sp.]MBO6895181.1 hypothetical protein [Roseibium sp.]
MKLRYLPIAAVVLWAVGSPAAANQFEAELNSLASGKIAEISGSDQVIEAIKVQNDRTGSFQQNQIDDLDRTWRAEADSIDQPMIDEVLGNALSEYLMDIQDSSDGLFTEIFVMDAKGLNVGQSDVTSDYWQGDEAKWKETFGQGAGEVLIGELEQDESTQLLQIQVSVTVTDPESGHPIGAMTFGVNIEKL